MKIDPAINLEDFFNHFSLVIDVIKTQQAQINSLQDAVSILTQENEALRDNEASMARSLDTLKSDLGHITYLR